MHPTSIHSVPSEQHVIRKVQKFSRPATWTIHKLSPCLLIMCLAVRSDEIIVIAGGGTSGDGGPATRAKLIEPFAVGFDMAGNTYVAQMEGGERIRKIDRKGIITTIAGTGEKGFSGDDGPAKSAQVNGPHHILVRPDGAVIIADTFNHRVRRIDPSTGIISTLAGTGKPGFSGDGGPANQAQFGGIFCLALSPNSDLLYICDLDNRRIRVMNRKSGIVTTVVGNGKRGIPEDGAAAIDAPLVDPRAIAVDSKGSLYILERSGNALRVVDAGGKIRTLVGAPNHNPPADIGPLNGPKHLCTDRFDNVFIADTENHRILKFKPKTGRLERMIGTGKKPSPDPTPLPADPLAISLDRPHGVFVRADGSIYVADSSNDRVLRIVR